MTPAIAAPDLFAGLLEWRQGDRWHRITVCEAYSVSKADMGPDAPVRFRYSAWLRGKGKFGIPTHLGCFDHPNDAEALCAAHYRGEHIHTPGQVIDPSRIEKAA
jgi:hypothetical protein